MFVLDLLFQMKFFMYNISDDVPYDFLLPLFRSEMGGGIPIFIGGEFGIFDKKSPIKNNPNKGLLTNWEGQGECILTL